MRTESQIKEALEIHASSLKEIVSKIDELESIPNSKRTATQDIKLRQLRMQEAKEAGCVNALHWMIAGSQFPKTK